MNDTTAFTGVCAVGHGRVRFFGTMVSPRVTVGSRVTLGTRRVYTRMIAGQGGEDEDAEDKAPEEVSREEEGEVRARNEGMMDVVQEAAEGVVDAVQEATEGVLAEAADIMSGAMGIVQGGMSDEGEEQWEEVVCDPPQFVVTAEAIAEARSKFRRHETDVGSPEYQIATLTTKIRYLTEHLKQNPKDYSSTRGLLKMVANRRRLLRYLKREDPNRFTSIIDGMQIRVSQQLRNI
eukprot:GFKZ01012235.1.p1 GENE.GFKZ01012235.1~~GFKZ01012235.1.p1  ORF type:complete len:235 (-),score=54.92 GFKZ01012235.1:296-1000(-)